MAISNQDTQQAARKLFENIKLMGKDGAPVQTICITSAKAGDGKTYVVSQLGEAIAAAGKTVLVVDDNLRHPTLAQELGVSAGAGSAKGDVLQNVVKTPTPGLSLLPAGDRVHSPLLLVSSGAFSKVLDQLKGAFDYVVFDTPDTKDYRDAISLAQHVDVTLLVVREHSTRREAVADALTELQDAKANVGGIVMNRVRNKKK